MDLAQARMKIDGPTNAEALGWEQPVVVGIPHRLKNIFPIPIHRHSKKRSFRQLFLFHANLLERAARLFLMTSTHSLRH